MNFFEQQDKARRQTRFLVFLFVLAVVAIIMAVNLLVLTLFGAHAATTGAPSSEVWRSNAGLVFASTLITGAVIGLASAWRSLQLRAGGGEIARQLGGSLVEPDTRDPLRRRLHNVVEEMAIASGIPVPEVYVLEHEQGINAFAAGYSTSDAAVAVTRGTLENLDRDELQGVIAHEFAHIFNGDMRLNIRLIGVLFGILVISIIGRRLLLSARFARDSRNAAPAVFIGLAVVIIGYVGLFFGRWIKAAVSRQREFLADASAVQFTRHPDGIGGALKKIGALQHGSFLTADSEEVGHMLFARGMGYQMFATHPPLEQRIQAIDPGFKPEQFQEIAEQLSRHAQARKAEAEEAARAASEQKEADKRGPGGLPLNPDNLAEAIGQPGLNQVFLAAALAAAIPKPLERAAHSDEWSQEVICYLLLDDDAEVREKQLLMIAKSLGSDSEGQVRALREAAPELAAEQRLPLMEMAFPAVRRHPPDQLVRLMKLIDDLIHADGRIDVFEYALARLVSSQIEDLLNPSRARAGGSKKLPGLADEARVLLTVLAHHGHPEQPDEARAALAVGLGALFDDASYPKALDLPDDWPSALDRALKSLDALRPLEKQRLVAAMARIVQHDGQVVAAEMELMRVICGVLHVPLPLFEQPGQPG